jgi:hypothetical protein
MRNAELAAGPRRVAGMATARSGMPAGYRRRAYIHGPPRRERIKSEAPGRPAARLFDTVLHERHPSAFPRRPGPAVRLCPESRATTRRHGRAVRTRRTRRCAGRRRAGAGRRAAALVTPTPAQLAIAARAGVEPAMLAVILSKQIHQMTPAEADRYIAYIHEAEPDFRKRVAAIGRKNIGQAYKLNLLGEFPFQVHDDLPMFSLTHGDCVVFSEHTYAMALSRSWEEFFWVLQRIRYNQGIIGVATRNHYTELDWNINNGWLVTDISADLAGRAPRNTR